MSNGFRIKKETDELILLTTQYPFFIRIVLLLIGVLLIFSEITFITLKFFFKFKDIPVAALIFPILMAAIIFTIIYFINKNYQIIEINKLSKKIITKTIEKGKEIELHSHLFTDIIGISILETYTTIQDKDDFERRKYFYHIELKLKGGIQYNSLQVKNYDIEKLNSLGEKLAAVFLVSFSPKKF